MGRFLLPDRVLCTNVFPPRRGKVEQGPPKIANQSCSGLLKSHQHSAQVKEGVLHNKSFSIWRMCKRVDPRSVAIIGFGHVGVRVACQFIMRGYSVCVYDSNGSSTHIRQTMQAKLTGMLNGLAFGRHLKSFSVSDIQTMLKGFSVAADLNELVSKGFKVVLECVQEVLEIKQQVFADLTALLHQHVIPARDIVLCSCTQGLSIRFISLGAAAPYKSRVIGLRPSKHTFIVTYQGEEQPMIAFIRTLARMVPTVEFEEAEVGEIIKRKLAAETPVRRLLSILLP
jgi:hypothetical protein